MGYFFINYCIHNLFHVKLINFFDTNKSNEFFKYVCDRQLPIITHTNHLLQVFYRFAYGVPQEIDHKCNDTNHHHLLAHLWYIHTYAYQHCKIKVIITLFTYCFVGG